MEERRKGNNMEVTNTTTVVLNTHDVATAKGVALVVVLPPKTVKVEIVVKNGDND
jgi:hypothetical protein